ncbi:MAG: MBL fold metallo-hydrolase [Gemmatimonadaceae bacterium]|nr:MBL fold metallo-hydrolase [Acetobacteraceae bacterium]
MSAFICVTCGTQYEPAAEPPAACAICTEERQFVGQSGQRWTTMAALRRSHFTTWREKEPGLIGLGIAPQFGIGQRALLIRTPAGNVLWDCVSLLDPSTVAAIGAIGGLAAIAISHPHYYTTMVDWADAFDCPVHLHAADRQWAMRASPHLQFWTGETTQLMDGITLIRAGGHYPGGTVLHWRDGAEGKGVLLSGDILQVVPSGWLTFMWSFPNAIPLSAGSVRRVGAAVEPFEFDRIYGAFSGRVVPTDARAMVARSVERYVAALQTERE